METTRLTRRQLGMVAAVAVPASGQQAASTPPPVNDLESARAAGRQAGAALRKVKLPQLLEPSFVFRP